MMCMCVYICNNHIIGEISHNSINFFKYLIIYLKELLLKNYYNHSINIRKLVQTFLLSLSLIYL